MLANAMSESSAGGFGCWAALIVVAIGSYAGWEYLKIRQLGGPPVARSVELFDPAEGRCLSNTRPCPTCPARALNTTPPASARRHRT
jgi:hypothetical protein